MEIREILNMLSEGLIDLESALDLISVYIDENDSKKVRTILSLISCNKVKVSSADNMITKLVNDYNTIPKIEITEKKEENSKHRKERRAARPLEQEEYVKIIELCKTGFEYSSSNGDKHIFRPNKQLGMTFVLQATLGLRISDVLKLKPVTFKNDKLEVIEKKTGKLQYRTINKNLKELIYEYALENNIKSNDPLIKIKVRAIQKQLEIIVNYLGLSNISSHSFRKFFGVTVYNQTNGNIELLKELFNHSSIATTQRYIKVSQKEIDRVSSSIDFTYVWNN